MTDLVERTRPGPFTARTIELGTYLGVRDEGRLVAMAGTRMRPAGYTEISAVCTDEGHRGRGLARLLVTRMVEEIEARDETPCLHALDSNAGAIRLYEQLGFTVRTVMTFAVVLPDQ
jgi:predicted GNAT family acetyltransferase